MKPTKQSEIPLWSVPRPILQFVAAIAALGLAVSLWAHVGALLGRTVLVEHWLTALTIGIIVVWFTAVFAGMVATKSGMQSSSAFFAGCQAWMKYGLYGLFFYVLVNFFLSNSMNEKHEGLTALDWRSFSGHFMLFYAAAFAVLYSRMRLEAKPRRCIQGHLVPSDATTCASCGEPVRR